MRSDWVEQVYFTVKDGIDKNADGSYTLVGASEDWDFSRQARRLGVQLWATRKVRLCPVGQGYFPNFAQWGTETQDSEAGAAHQVGLMAGMCPLLNHQPATP